MRKSFLLFMFSLIFSSIQVLGQDTISTPAQSRKANLKQLLDYRFRGGFYSFERLFLKTVVYPEFAKKNCVIGIMIVRFDVDCNGEISNLSITNPLKWGIDEEVQKFFNETIGNWNKCSDDKYTRFEVPIQFTINQTATNDKDAMLVYQVDLVGYNCKGDDYFREKLADAMEKNNKKKSLKYISELIKRNPYESDLYEIRKDLMEPKKK